MVGPVSLRGHFDLAVTEQGLSTDLPHSLVKPKYTFSPDVEIRML
jgi:hypothetical protein